MAFGGVVTELVITCQSGEVPINKGDALALITVSNVFPLNAPIFGQAMASCHENGAALPVRGNAILTYWAAVCGMVGLPQAGVVASGVGMAHGGSGINLKVDPEKYVLL